MWLRLLLALLSLVLLPAPAAFNTRDPVDSYAGQPIFAIGDSVTYGVAVGPDETWPHLLEQETGKRVMNLGVGGFTIRQETEVLKAMLARGRVPKLVIVMDGLNEEVCAGTVHDPTLTTKQYRDCARTDVIPYIRAINTLGVRYGFATLFVLEPVQNPPDHVFTMSYYEAIVAESDVPVLNWRTILAHDCFADWQHPNAKGNAVLASALARLLPLITAVGG